MRLRRTVTAFASVLLGATVLVPTAQAQDATTTVERVAGDDRVTTAIALSQRAFSSADTAVLATADDFADALAGVPLAAAVDGPLLLTAAGSLDDRVVTELRRLGVDEVVLLGGQAALSSQVEDLGQMMDAFRTSDLPVHARNAVPEARRTGRAA